jgi:hypothetical protein
MTADSTLNAALIQVLVDAMPEDGKIEWYRDDISYVFVLDGTHYFRGPTLADAVANAVSNFGSVETTE